MARIKCDIKHNKVLIFCSGIAVLGVVLFVIKLILLCTEGL